MSILAWTLLAIGATAIARACGGAVWFGFCVAALVAVIIVAISVLAHAMAKVWGRR